MTNVEIFTVTELNGIETEWVKIATGEDAYMWQLKSVYDAQLELSTEIVAPSAE